MCTHTYTQHSPLVLLPVLPEDNLTLEDMVQSDKNAQSITDMLKYSLYVDAICLDHLEAVEDKEHPSSKLLAGSLILLTTSF